MLGEELLGEIVDGERFAFGATIAGRVFAVGDQAGHFRRALPGILEPERGELADLHTAAQRVSAPRIVEIPRRGAARVQLERQAAGVLVKPFDGRGTGLERFQKLAVMFTTGIKFLRVRSVYAKACAWVRFTDTV